MHCNPITNRNDQEVLSPYRINTSPSRQVRRIKKNINVGMLFDLRLKVFKTKFSELTRQENYG